METSISNGVSALLSFQTALDVEANNAANIKSTAFKTDTISFADMFYEKQVGYGVSTNTPIKDFSQGQLVPTNSDYDFAIEGEGFFTLQHPEQAEKIFYSRAGQFKSDKDNYLVDPNGMIVMGIKPTVSGDVITSRHTNNVATSVIDTGDSTVSINTYISQYSTSTAKVGSTGSSGDRLKTEGANNTDIEELIYEYNNALKAFSINPVEGEDISKAQASVTYPLSQTIVNEQYTLEVVVDGVKFQQNYEESAEKTLQLLSDKVNQLAGVISFSDTTTGELTIESMIPGKNLSVTQARANNSNLFINQISQESGSGQKLIDGIYSELQALVNTINNKLESDNASLPVDEQLSVEELENLKIHLATNRSEIRDLSSGDQVNFEPMVLDLNQLGMNSTLYEKLVNGDVTTVAAYPGITSEDGKLYLTDGDARFLVGMLVPVDLSDKTILNPEGDNLYSNTDNSIVPFYIENMAKVYGGYLENSNVDLSKELVNILAFQKAFEANSKSITTSDEMMQTALGLKTN